MDTFKRFGPVTALATLLVLAGCSGSGGGNDSEAAIDTDAPLSDGQDDQGDTPTDDQGDTGAGVTGDTGNDADGATDGTTDDNNADAGDGSVTGDDPGNEVAGGDDNTSDNSEEGDPNLDIGSGSDNGSSTAFSDTGPLVVRLDATGETTPGGFIHYRASVGNISDTALSEVSAEYLVQENVSFSFGRDAQPNATGCFSRCEEDDVAEWSLGLLEPGQTRIIDLRVDVADTVAPATVIESSFVFDSPDIAERVFTEASSRVDIEENFSLVVSTSDNTILAGETVSIALDLGNIGAATLDDLVLEMELPDGVVFNGSGSDVSQIGNVLTWNIDQIPLLQTVRRDVEVTALLNTPPGALLQFTASLTAAGEENTSRTSNWTLAVEETESPLQVSYDLSSDAIAAGDTVRTVVTVSNTGLVPIEDILVLQRLPEDILTIARFAYPAIGNICLSGCGAGTELYWNFNSLGAGESYSLELVLDTETLTHPGALIRSEFLVFADAIENTQVNSRILRSDNLSVARLALNIGGDELLAGDTVNATVSVGNISDAAITGSTITLDFPDELTATAATDSGAINSADNSISWVIDELPVSSAAQLTATFTISSDVQPGQLFDLNTTLAHDGGSETDLRTSAAFNVRRHANVSLLGIATDSEQADAGEILRYTISLTNNDLVPLEDAVVHLRVPEGVSFRPRDAEPTAGGVCRSSCGFNDRASWSYSSIAVGETVTIEIPAFISDSLTAGDLIVFPIDVRASSSLDSLNLTDVRVVR